MTTFDCADPVARRDGLEAAAFAAETGNLVVMPTDTVYGIGANAFNVAAVRNLLVAKGRGPDMPVPVLVGSWSRASAPRATSTSRRPPGGFVGRRMRASQLGRS